MARKHATKTKKIIRGVDVPYANQYLLDPRQKLCWDSYIDPKSPTFGNATQSALKAGFSEGHAAQITTQDWWLVKARRLGLLSKAERNLEEALDFPSQTQAMGAFGPLFEMTEEKVKVKLKNGKTKTKIKKVKGKPIMAYNVGLINIRTHTAEFVAERVGRAMYGRKEQEGGDVFNIFVFNDKQRSAAAKRIIERGSSLSGGGEAVSD